MKWVVPALLMLVALAGCFGGADDAEDDTGEQPTVDSDAGNVTNSPPVIEFAANRTEGPAPLDVRFDFNASDPDGGNLTWTLDVDGDGTVDSEGAVLPFNFTFTFSTPGTFNATLNVTDGTNATVDVITIVVEDAEEEGEEGEAQEMGPNEEQSGSSGFCLDYNVLYGVAGAEEPLGPRVEVEAGTDFVTTSSSGTAYVDFMAEDGASVGYGTGEGTVPDGAAYGIMCVDAGTGYPAAPMPVTGDWTYQDGF